MRFARTNESVAKETAKKTGVDKEESTPPPLAGGGRGKGAAAKTSAPKWNPLPPCGGG